MPACHAGGRGFEPLPGRHFPFRRARDAGCAGVAQLAEQLICNQQVAGSSPFTSFIFFMLILGWLFAPIVDEPYCMEEFPSGQREQTVNLLSPTSVVRIHPPPLLNPTALKAIFLREWRNWQTRTVQVRVGSLPCRFKSCFPHHSSLFYTEK